ncbi:NAC domain-containing protein [Melia azedarach]|uniref:NAC domain-containing protein n=1 Tax=Melia azedarach TaxID=155640 RepID=A0ACC1X5J0_MELAZ|nr:NAC domain-containing protein [Melia azedarach]
MLVWMMLSDAFCDNDAVKECDLYGDQEPWDIWNFHRGNDLLKDEELYFFTQLKKITPNGSRYNRKIASGSWQGEDGAKEVKARGGSEQIIGFKKRFRYEDGNNSEQNGGWIMNEFSINPSLLGRKYSQKAMDYVLCRIKRNKNVQKKENVNLGKRQRKSTQIGEKDESGLAATGRKRELKQAATSNKNDDKCVLNKRLRDEQVAVLVQQNQTNELSCTNKVLKVVDSEAGTETVRTSNTFGEEEETLQVVEYEAETEPLLDFEELFSRMDDKFDLIFTSTDLEYLTQ